MSWREQMEDLAASVWTNRKASPGDVRADIMRIVKVDVPEDMEDALEPLSTEQVRDVLIGLSIETDYVQDHSDLCPECYALPGGCGTNCGQYEELEEERDLVEVPRSEEGMVSLLNELVYSYLDDNFVPERWSTRTFEEAQIMTKNKGLVVRIKDVEYQLTVVKSK